MVAIVTTATLGVVSLTYVSGYRGKIITSRCSTVIWDRGGVYVCEQFDAKCVPARSLHHTPWGI